MKNWLLITTFFGLWLSTQLPSDIQDYFAYALILTFGVLHGANDIVLLKKQHENLKTTKAIIPYILVISTVTLLFLFSRTLVLAIFILISGYHFGEQHYKEKLAYSHWFHNLFFIFYGLSILFMIFYTNLEEVQQIIYDVSGHLVQREYIELGFLVNLIGLSGSLVFLTLNKVLRVQWAKEIFMFLVLYIVFKVASLLWAFSIYFILWHSIPSIKDQMEVLYGSSKPRYFINYLRSSWIYWFVSVVGLLVLYLLLKNQIEYFITVVLYVLAVITFPHVIVMSKLEKNKGI
ncbi:Brp/Blh family beta-carotene 15,15'-dioxygenase [Maribacter sp. 4G9]|uniref:Brp/Blh family beta-carotene 15,15'-dioxygenase n=1 Tax=Maribacter sp. 4G9 TaxID=1889777 RepID=UPI000C160D1D|nr:Brp/Blh family beta-carotene 15,15'-dioxygenase [Maribacter sp. 4G9]PIB28164.1 hypothetical protein BFP75_05520 [Maribacter sp. 4G9]